MTDDELTKAAAAIISPSAFKEIPRGKVRPKREGETTGSYKYADRSCNRARATRKAAAILALYRAERGQ